MAKRGRPKKKAEEKVEIKVEIDGSKLEVDETQEKEDVQKAGEAYYQRKFLKKEPEVVEKAEVIEPEVPPEPEPELPPEPEKEDNHPREKLLSFDEVARGFGIAEHLVDTWVERKGLVSVNVGGVRMITYGSVLNCPFKRFG